MLYIVKNNNLSECDFFNHTIYVSEKPDDPLSVLVTCRNSMKWSI